MLKVTAALEPAGPDVVGAAVVVVVAVVPRMVIGACVHCVASLGSAAERALLAVTVMDVVLSRVPGFVRPREANSAATRRSMDAGAAASGDDGFCGGGDAAGSGAPEGSARVPSGAASTDGTKLAFGGNAPAE